MAELNNSIVKAMKILELFMLKDELSIAEISRESDYSKSAINRILSSFESMEYVYKNSETGKYRLGNKFYYLGLATNVNNNIVEKAKPFVEKLANDLDLTISMSVMEAYKSVIVHQRRSEASLSITPNVGNRRSLNCSATGKVLTAFSKGSQDIIEVMEFSARTPNTIVDKEEFRKVIHETQIKGFACEDEEVAMGLFCIAMPVLDKHGNMICVISVSGYRKIVKENFDEIRNSLSRCVNEVALAISR